MNELVIKTGKEPKETITSLELLEQINLIRTGIGKKEIQHYDLTKIIRREFKHEIDTGKISCISYRDNMNRKQKNYILSFSLARVIATKQGREIQRAVFDYIERLENELKNALERERLQVRAMGKALRNLETSTIQRLLEYGNIPKEKWKLYFANYTMIAYRIMGYKKKPERDEMNAQELSLLQQLETVINVTIIENISKNVPHYLIYQDCRDKATEVFRKVRSLFISEIDKATQRGFELMEQEHLGLM